MNTLYHPATGYLLRAQTRGKLKRIEQRFQSPRKRLIAVFALLLGLLWVGQAIATVFFRQSADPERLTLWLPLALMSYAAWHFIKLATKAPEEPFAWTPAEQEYVLAAPLSRTQQITYRMLSIFNAALAKAICFAILMLPDLPSWGLGFVGMLLGLIYVDLIRVCAESFLFGLGIVGRRVFRFVVLSLAIFAFGYALTNCFLSSAAEAELASPGALAFFQHLFSELIGLGETEVGQFCLMPFKVFTTIALSNGAGWITNLLVGGTMVAMMLWSVYWFDTWMLSRRRCIERQNLERALASKTFGQENSDGIPVGASRTWVPWKLRGAGGLIWRQGLGAIHYRDAVLFSLAVPAFLSCLPLFASHAPLTMLMHIVGGAIFYSFLLLPSALILDFRRDINRMTVLKSLPVRPIYVVLGQLTAPVTICWFFQGVVLLVAIMTGKVIWWQAMVAFLLMLPVNVLIFAIENYIFLLSPYQRNKEGFDVFLRTVLTFTGKGLLFAVGVGLVMVWAMIAVTITSAAGISPWMATTLFCGGIWCIALAVAGMFVMGITRQFVSFDPSQDIPGQG